MYFYFGLEVVSLTLINRFYFIVFFLYSGKHACTVFLYHQNYKTYCLKLIPFKYLASHKNLKVITFIVLQIFVMPIATIPNQKPGQQWQAVLPLLHGMLDRKLNKPQNSNGNNLHFGSFLFTFIFFTKSS